MSESLSRSLVHAAAEAIGETTCDHMAHFGQVDCDACCAQAAVAAVLETLAAELPPAWSGLPERLRRLAAETRTET